MGVAQLREAFNAVAAPKYTATQAFLSYQRGHDAEFQVLRFVGVGQDGAPFSTESAPQRAGSDLMVAAAATARALTSPPTQGKS